MSTEEKLEIIKRKLEYFLTYANKDEDELFINKWDLIALLKEIE